MSRETDLAECAAAMKHVIRKLEGLLRKEVRVQPGNPAIQELEGALVKAKQIKTICERLR